MKKYKLLLLVVVLFLGMNFVSCVGDLDTDPIGPIEKPEDILDSEDAFYAFLAKCYMGLATSGTDGPSSSDIAGIDNGYGQYIRALFSSQEYTTDECIMGWGDLTIQDLHGLRWTSSDVFISSMYYRCSQQIVTCNEFIRRAQASKFAGSENINLWIAEARALRILSYYHAIDLFGNFPFVTENSPVGIVIPPQKTRVELFSYIESECKEIVTLVKDENIYGRLNKSFVNMILAKLYLNAEVYIGEARYKECADVCAEIMTAYPTLHDNYEELFLSDNSLRTNEIIFAIQQQYANPGVDEDGNSTTQTEVTMSYGATNFLIFAATGGSMPAGELMGINSGWQGLRTTPDFVDLFEEKDKRALFYTDGQTKEIETIGTFTDGYAIKKFRNRTSDNKPPIGYIPASGDNKELYPAFVNTDYPLFRNADAFLMLAECAKRDNTLDAAEGLRAYNAVHERAGLEAVTYYSLDDVLEERGRELYWECTRRTDLIRFDKFTTDSYLWAWKGGVKEGQAVDAKFNIMPLPAQDININPNLTQNPGY